MNASEQLIKAAKSGNTKEVRKLLSRGAVFTKDEFGNTALHEASWTGNNDIVKILLKAYCYVDSVNGVGFTPLHLASQNGHAKVAKTLLKWKANPALKNQYEETPIHLVAKYDHAHIVPIFAAAKADLDLKAKDENTALHIAAKLGNIATVKALVQNGANPNINNMKSKLPIDYAEIGNYHSTVKILIPFTERPIAAGGRRATIDSILRSKTPTELDMGRRGKKHIFRSKSPKTSKKNLSSDSPRSLKEVDFRMRKRSDSQPVGSAPLTRRYSREFEDIQLTHREYSSSSSVSSYSPSAIYYPISDRSDRSTTRSPSLDDLLEDVEREVHGPHYRFVPRSSDSEDSSSVTYKPVHKLSIEVRSPRPLSETKSSPIITNLTSVAASLPNLVNSSSRHRHSPNRSPNQKKDPIYDNLAPQGGLMPKSQTHTEICSEHGNEKELKPTEEDSYVCLRPSIESDKRSSPDGQDSSNLYSHPVLSDEVINHRYEYLPPLSKTETGTENGFESYIYMAPRNDYKPPVTSSTSPLTSSTSPLKSPQTKKAVICAHRVHPPSKHDSKPPKPILTQFSGIDNERKSELEKYLNDELDTIRQAFQIRLKQMEKRYKRQLASVSALHKTSSNSTTGGRPINLGAKSHKRRSSWHGKMDNRSEDDAPPTGIVNLLENGFESGSDESLNSSVAGSSCYNDDYESSESPEPIPSELNPETDSSGIITPNSLDEVEDIHAFNNPSLVDFMIGEETVSLPPEGKLIKERIQEYKARMMDYLMLQAEERMSAMEEEYKTKIDNAQRLYHLPGEEKALERSETFV